ncbi:MAG TPA: hypothetical protein PKI49_13420, partial [Pseudomonadota bacterium]|nr:hypothetical protein [Pseudomonadota bacterium]
KPAAAPVPAAAPAPVAKPAVAPAAVAPAAAKPAVQAAPAVAPAKPVVAQPAVTPAAAKPAVAPAAVKPAVVATPAPAAKPAPSAAPAVKPAPAPAAKPAPGAMLEPASLKALARAFDGMAAAQTGAATGKFTAQMQQMQQAGQRDDVVAILLDAVKPYANQVALFVIQQRQFACLDGRGSNVDMLKWVQFSTEEPSPFNTVTAGKEPHLGPLPASPENQSAMTALGSSSGPLLMVPLMFKGRGIGVLYADELKGDLRPLLADFVQLADEAATAFARIILARKKSG